MANEETNIELIENYLSGNLSGTEKLQFEQQLMNDSALKDELSFQKMIKESIIDYRKAEIKGRLNNLTPASGSSSTSWLTAIAASAVIGVSTWFGFQYLNNSTKDTNVKVTTEAKTETTSKQLVVKTPDFSNPTIETIQESNIGTTKSNKVNKPKVNSTKSVKNTDNDDNLLESGPIAPEEPLVSSNEQSINANSAELNHNNKSHSVIQSSSIPTPVIKSSKDKFQYTHTSDQLVLWGDFSKSPYEILELNKNKEKRTFLYYEKEFYELLNHVSEPKKLEKLGDKTLIQELKQRLKHK